MNPASYAIMLWSLGKFGTQLQMISIDGRPFDSFLQNFMEHVSTQYGSMTAEQLASATAGLAICCLPSLESFFRILYVGRRQTTVHWPISHFSVRRPAVQDARIQEKASDHCRICLQSSVRPETSKTRRAFVRSRGSRDG